MINRAREIRNLNVRRNNGSIIYGTLNNITGSPPPPPLPGSRGIWPQYIPSIREINVFGWLPWRRTGRHGDDVVTARRRRRRQRRLGFGASAFSDVLRDFSRDCLSMTRIIPNYVCEVCSAQLDAWTATYVPELARNPPGRFAGGRHKRAVRSPADPATKWVLSVSIRSEVN